MNTTHQHIEAQIDAYFIARSMPFSHADVIRVRDMRIGGRKLSMQRQADELGGISRTTLYKWQKHLQ